MKNLTEDNRFPAKIQTRDLPLERIIHNDDQKKKKIMWKESITGHFNVLSQHLPRTEENHEEPQTG
jgi:hypothetical protein